MGKSKIVITKKMEEKQSNHSQLPKGGKPHDDVQGKKEDAQTKRDGVITKVVDSSSHLPFSSPADIIISDKEKGEDE